MEAAILIDMLFGVLAIVIAVLLRRTFQMFDRLQDEDKVLARQIASLGRESVSRSELHTEIDRIIRHIDMLEAKIMDRTPVVVADRRQV